MISLNGGFVRFSSLLETKYSLHLHLSAVGSHWWDSVGVQQGALWVCFYLQGEPDLSVATQPASGEGSY